MTNNWPLVALLLLAAMVIGLLLHGRRFLFGTTMMAPWLWCLVSISVIVLVELLIATGSAMQIPAWAGTARYTAAVGTFCPIMAVLGAKRPQDRGWQWVVLTLWIVLSMPAAHSLVTRTEVHFQIHFAWKVLLTGLMGMQTINYVGARTVGAAILMAMSQFSMLAPQLLVRYESSSFSSLMGMGLLLLAATAAWMGSGRTSEQSSNTMFLWQRFLYLYGTFWTFRAMGLINQTAIAANWPVVLLPDGFYDRTSLQDRKPATDLSPDLERAVHQSLRNTLRRFLSERELAACHLPTDPTT